ncbi:DUF4250 domain-containing protein [Pelagicoccus mobilis]|nr:DUF4250 domain-containing protein [Pelagicoccus mobilis]
MNNKTLESARERCQNTHPVDWNNIHNMDPNLLVGIVNTALRNHFESLDDLCLSHAVDKDALCQQLAAEDYEYIEAANQFR